MARRRRRRSMNPFRRRRRRSSRRLHNPIRRRRRRLGIRRRRRNPRGWTNNAEGHRAASRKGWRRRKHGARRYLKGRYKRGPKRGRRRSWIPKTSRGRKYKKPYKSKRTGKFMSFRNPKHGIRTRNPGAMDIVVPTLVAIAGMVGASFLMSKLPDNIKTKVPYAPVVIPVAAGLLVMMFLTKAMPKQSKILFGLGSGMVIAGGIALYNQMAPAGMPKIGGAMSGYTLGWGWKNVRQPAIPSTMRGYVRSLSGYAPYGVGVPKENRQYNEYTFGGIYKKSVYE